LWKNGNNIAQKFYTKKLVLSGFLTIIVNKFLFLLIYSIKIENMNYSKIQKIISSFLLFIFFFGQIFWLSFFSLFSNSVFADNTDFHDLVSIIVTEDIYDELDSEIDRYAEDIQNYLDNTKVVILPIKNDTTSFSIASMNESLFYEGYKWLKEVDFESRLIWTVIIWDVELPIIEDTWKTTKSIVPFTDFEDKQFIYNHKTKLFEKNRENLNWLKPEIFHWIISPNTWDKEKNIEKIKDFLDKDHDFYVWENLFDSDKVILNWKVWEEINSEYKPFVFYFDQIREKKAISYTAFKWYEAYLSNKEDLLYHRYSQDLNDKIQEDINWAKEAEISNALQWIENPAILEAFKDTKSLDATWAPDISLKHIIDASTNTFLEVFNKWTISDFRTNVHNAWRYNKWSSKVNVDMIPYIITILDNITDKWLKWANDDLESYIFDKVSPEIEHVPIPVSIFASEWLPKKILAWEAKQDITPEPSEWEEYGEWEESSEWERIPEEFFSYSENLLPEDIIFSDSEVSISYVDEVLIPYVNGWDNLGLVMTRALFAQILEIISFTIKWENVYFKIAIWEDVKMKVSTFKKIIEEYSSKYNNFYYWKASEYLGWLEWGAWSPEACTIYRGSTENWGQLVEENHWFNPRNWEPDANLIKDCRKLNIPFEHNEDKISAWYWGGNSILNFKDVEWVSVLLHERDTTLAIEDLHDPLWAELRDTPEKNPSINNCYEYNYLLTKKPINTFDPAKQAEKMWHWGFLWINVFYENTYRVPVEFSMNKPRTRIEPQGWTCHTKNQKFHPEVQTPGWKIYVISTLLGMLKSVPWEPEWDVPYNWNDWVETAADCLVNWIELWYWGMWGERKLIKASTYDGDILCPVTRYKYHFTSTEGFVEAQYPNNDTLNGQISNPWVPNVPSNRDRFLEIFTGDTIKIPYPYLFRAKLDPELDSIPNNSTIEFEAWSESSEFGWNWTLNEEDLEIDSLTEFIIMNKIKTIISDININNQDKIDDIKTLLSKYEIKEESLIFKIQNSVISEKENIKKIEEIKNIIEEYEKQKVISDEEKRNLYTMEWAKKALDRFLEEYDNRTGGVLEVKAYVTSKEDQIVMIWNEEKIFNYYDFLAFSVLWNNMPSVSAKYKFVMQHYLSDQVWWNEFKFILPKNKKQYEISYMWGHWDAKNMYIKIEPEDNVGWNLTSEGVWNPYLDINSKNNLLNSNKISVWVLNWTNKINYNAWNVENLPVVNYEDWLFKCSPPEWVPIREWLPAVMCRLEWLLPVEISVWAWECSATTAFESDDDVDYYHLLDEQTEEQEVFETQNAINNPNSNKSDSNQNWINDFCENKIKNNWKLNLYSDSSRYSFKSRGILRTEVLDKDWKRIMLDNSSNITFSLKKIVDKKTWEIIFDKSKDSFKNKKQEIKKYISFKEFESKSRYWEAKYSFATKNKISDIYFEANLDLRNSKNLSIKKIKSNPILIKIRSEKLFLSSKKILEDKSADFGKTIKVNNKTNVYIYDQKNIELDTENLNSNSIALWLLNIWADSKNKNINFPINIILRDSKKKIIRRETLNNLNSVKELFNIKKSWSYKIEVTDKYDYKVITNIEVLSLEPSKIKVDLWTNILEKDWSISTNIISIYDKFDNIVLWEKYSFDLNILWNSIEFENNNSKNLKLSTYEWYKAFRIKSTNNSGISKIVINLYKNDKKLVTTSKNIKVLDELKLKIEYSDILKVWNNEYEANLEFLDKNNKLISDLNSRVYMSAWEEYIKLIDAYNNIINWKAKIKFKTKTLSGENKTISFRIEWFNSIIDKSVTILPEKAFWLSFVNTKTKLEADWDNESYINVELRDIYNNLVFTDSDSIISLELLDKYKTILKTADLNKTLYKWKASFKINATDLPGKSYLKVSINKELEKNEFIVWKADKEVKINWISENALMIETYFFYNKKSIEGKKYNSLYTTLLWAEYWDITQKDYLAWAMIFDKENRSLAVTSLLNSPYNKLDAIKISSEWIITKTYDKTDLTQDVTISLKKDLNKNYYLDLFNSALNVYIWKIYLNFENLDINPDIYSKVASAKEIDIKILLNIEELEIYSASNKVKLNSLLENKQNSLIVYMWSSDYKIRDLYSKKGNAKSIYYIDPFATEFSLNSFSRYSQDTYDNFEKNKKVWWTAWNKTLLAFAAWESVWDSTRQYMWVSGINIWDPIISLKKINKKAYWITKKFDATIWKKLNKNEIKSYRVFDYNADNLDDILLIEKNWLFSLLENTKKSKWFLNQKHLARVVDIWNFDFVATWDFSGDRYEDIFFVNKKWEPFLLNNNKKDFIRIDLRENFALKWKIIQAKSFDMNNDWIDDIVTLDDSWEINIFYWKWATTDFIKNNIHSWYGMKLSNKVTNNMWVIYFDWLTQDINKWTIPKDYTNFRSVDIIENLMFEKIAYDTETDITEENYTKNTTFIKSEFASQVWITVERTYKDENLWELKTWDIVIVEIKLKNTTKWTINNIVYAESIPKYFTLESDSIKTDKVATIGWEIWTYQFMIEDFNIPSGWEIKITYNVKTRALAYWNIKVWLFEKGELWDDKYGDILLSSSKNNCWGDSDIFKSINERSYKKWLKKQSCDESQLPEELAKNDIDEDWNWIPDYIDDLTPENPEAPTEAEVATMAEYAKTSMADYWEENKVEEETNIYYEVESINDKIDDLSSDVENLIDWFGCWFGWWSCFSMPINWAPLAPWNDISTPFWLIWDWLKVEEWIPVFSALTWIITKVWCIPSFWPLSPLSLWSFCTKLWAWGYLWTESKPNFFRFFITPTLTGWIWAAACFGWPASIAWQIPPSLVTPFVPYWNCVIAAAPFPGLCEDEEIAWDPSSIGQVEYMWSEWWESWWNNWDWEWWPNWWNNWDWEWYWVINWNCDSESGHKPLPISNKIDTSLAQSYLSYRESWIQTPWLVWLIDEKFWDIEDREIDYNSSLLKNEPLISIAWWDVNDSDISVSLDFSEDWNGIKFNAVEELKQERIAPFPRFITQWVNDQIEEFITKLVDFPTFYIILPDFSKIMDTDWWEYTDKIVSETKKSYQTWGIKEAYKFLWNVPFITIEWEIVNINIPEIDPEYYHTIISQWKLVLQSYPEQIEEAVKSWKYSPESIVSAREFAKNLEINIGILETYKDIPWAISKLFNKKQEYLEQIMCNIETIENITWGWLWFNWKRFKAWVELYILIKAILKSWQVLVDIFQDYDESCHECKNERWDSTQWEWTLISIIAPSIPVIQFPKWPDVVLDIHDIRMNLAVKLPEFKVNYRPIVLPPAPLLLLPNYNYRVPPLDILPLLEIPELPDIPSLPTVKLPDLPPPPSLPKIWSSIETFMKILKLIVKMMCILKKVPLVPEHRAWNQIAFLTESPGYRWFDFIDKLLPNFSYPYLDEIKITSYINLEDEVDFITEMARTIVSPINDFTNDFTHIFDWKSAEDIDLSKHSKSAYNNNNQELISSSEFLSLVNKELSKDYITKNPKLNELKHSFDIVNNYTYSKEDKLIAKLQKANYEKFDVLKSIIKREIKKTKKLKIDSKDILNNSSSYIKISNTDTNDIKIYNSTLKKYNDAFKDSAKNLINPTYFDTDSIKESWKNILTDLKNTTDNYDELIKTKTENTFSTNNKPREYLAQNKLNINKNYLSATTQAHNSGWNCSANKKSKYSREYKWIYIIQWKLNYKLFDYLDDLNWDEIITEIDYDLDWDSDLLYSMNNNLYLKENIIENKKDKIYLSWVEVLDIDDNKFINWDIYYESVNDALESYVANEYINISFKSHSRQDISNYKLEYYSIIDKYLNKTNDNYIPENITKNIIDAFSNIEDWTIIETSTGVIVRQNLWYIYEVWNNISKIKLKTKELINLWKNSLNNWNIAIISGWTNIYAWWSSTELKYLKEDIEEEFTIKIDSYTNIEFEDTVKITWISWDAYVVWDKDIILVWNEIYDYLKLPILPNTKIYKFWDFNETSSSHIWIKYYDDSENNIDFRKTNSYGIYNLGIKAKNYSITLNTPNDYFYSTLQVFKNNIYWTKNSQILLSPQLESDRDAPELDFNSKIRIPVYQNKIIDLTDSIYENSWLENISEFKIEWIDESKYEILKTTNKFRINFGKFDNIFTKKIKFIIKDSNYNVLKKDVDLEVYPPIPEINSYTGSLINWIIDEELDLEPINLYRFRWGSIKRLKTSSWTTTVDTISWKFDFNLSTINSDLIDIKLNENNVFNVNENTWKINLLNPLYNIKAKINDDNFVKISVLDNFSDEIFSEIIKLKSIENEVTVTDDFSSIKENWLYVRLLNSEFDYYKISDSVKINAWALVIYRKTDSKKDPLFAILPDSRIKVLNWFYKIEYSTFNEYIMLKLIDKHFNKEVWQLLFKIDSSYIIR